MKRGALLTLFLLIFAGACASSPAYNNVYFAEVGYHAPDFTLPKLDKSGNLTLSDLRGNVVVLTFLTSWCPYCNEEAPHQQSLYEEYKDEGVVFLAVGEVFYNDSSSDLRKFVERHSITFPVVVDITGDTSKTYFAYNRVPANYFIGKDGVICYRWPGGMTEGMIRERIESILSGVEC